MRTWTVVSGTMVGVAVGIFVGLHFLLLDCDQDYDADEVN